MSVESYRESPGKFDSRTLNRTTLERWTGRRIGSTLPYVTLQVLTTVDTAWARPPRKLTFLLMRASRFCHQHSLRRDESDKGGREKTPTRKHGETRGSDSAQATYERAPCQRDLTRFKLEQPKETTSFTNHRRTCETFS